MIYCEHWIFDPDITKDHTNTPKSKPQLIKRCLGCNLHHPYYIGDVRPKCILYLKNSECVTIKTSSYTFHNRTAPSNIHRKLHSAHHTLKTISYNDYIIRNNLYTPPILNLDLSFSVLVNTTLINTLLDTHNDIKSELISISNHIKSTLNLEFYTDGSLFFIAHFLSEWV
jgi:hypothetical protein